MLRVLNPVQEPRAVAFEPPPRPGTLEGKVLGLYSNEKLNADLLLTMIAEELGAEGRFTVRRGVYDPARLMEPAEWQGLEACDVVILANGDCGACSSTGIANAIAVEKRGVPAFLVSTPPFTEAVRTMARMCGMPDARWAIVEHPIGSVGEAEVRARATAAAEQFRAAMLTPNAAAAPQPAAA
jgi:hypothetical protein